METAYKPWKPVACSEIHHITVAATAAAQQQPQFVHAQQPQPQVGLPSHYPSAAGTDMRSPPVMSPNQNAQLPPSQQQMVAGRVPQQAPPHMVPQHPTLMDPSNPMTQMGLVSAQRIAAPSQYFGVDPGMAERLDPTLCLAGCVFVFFEDNMFIDRQALTSSIRLHGGDVEHFNPRTIPDRVTHVVCNAFTRNPLFKMILNEGRKRLVTVHWLYDTVAKRRMEPPTRPAHFPTQWEEHQRVLRDKVVAVSGFDDSETKSIKAMLNILGARYTPFLSEHNNLLICTSIENENVPKARELDIQTVNFQWLMEVYFGSQQALKDLNNARYMPRVAPPPLGVTLPTNCFERINETYARMLVPWKRPVVVSEQALGAAMVARRSVENDGTVFPERRIKFGSKSPSEEQIEKAVKILEEAGKVPDVRVFFEGLREEQVAHLSRKLRFLGGKVVEKMADCTHYVSPSLRRTRGLLEAMARGLYVCSPDWIVHSFEALELHDGLDFFVQDKVNERRYGFNLYNTIMRARQRKIFEGVTCHVSPSVLPAFDVLSELIAAGGGSVDKPRPSRQKLAQCIENDDTYLLVVNEADIHWYKYLTNCGVPLFNEEFILMAILRHQLDTSAAYRVKPRPPWHSRPPPLQLPPQRA
ncbi:Pax transcription activation domain interacting protein [Aphelenchoides avenae]|nr:Pax transcription activation domain interacting protein [Aphelenchus avenae]